MIERTEREKVRQRCAGLNSCDKAGLTLGKCLSCWRAHAVELFFLYFNYYLVPVNSRDIFPTCSFVAGIINTNNCMPSLSRCRCDPCAVSLFLGLSAATEDGAGAAFMIFCSEWQASVRGHHNPPPITPASSDSPRYIPPHKWPNHRQLLETRP